MSLGDPRVMMQIVDLSMYVEEIAKGWVVVLGQAERGEPWKPYYLESEGDYYKHLGNTVDWSRDPLTVLTALQNGAKIVFIRLVHCTDVGDRSTMTPVCASCLIPDRGGLPTAGSIQSNAGPFTFAPKVAGGVTGTEIGPFAFATDTNDKFAVRVGVPGSWGDQQTVTMTTGTRTAQQSCDDINAGTNGLNATVVNGRVRVDAINPGHDVEVLAVANDAYSTLGLNEAVYAHEPGTDYLAISVDGGLDQEFTLVAAHDETGAFGLTSAELATQLNGIVGGTVTSSQGRIVIASGTTGEDSSVQVKPASTADTPIGLDNDQHSGTAGEAKSPWRFELLGPGKYGNTGKIYFYDTPLLSGQAMNVRIRVPGCDEEYYSDLVRDPDNPRYWKNYINERSLLGQFVDVDDPNPEPYDWPELNSVGISLTGGDDGVQVLTDADYVGNAAAGTGIYAAEKVRVPAIDHMPIGTTSAVVVAEYIEWMDNHVGRMAHCQCPEDMPIDHVIDWRLGEPPDYSHAAFNSPNMTLTMGYPVVFDSRNNGKVPIPAQAYLAAAITRTDEDYGPHYAPFGVKRGICDGVLALKHNMGEDSAAADLAADFQINDCRILRWSIEHQGWEGSYLWGNYTSQRIASAFREFNVTRLIKSYEWALLPLLLGFVFDPNHPVTWKEVDHLLQPFFRREADKYAVYGYFIQTDKDAFFAGGELKGAVLNTGLDIDQGKYRCRILIQPTRAIRYFICEMGVMRTGDPFARYSELYKLPGWVRRV